MAKTRLPLDYSIGFRREAFTGDQLKRLEPFVGDLTDKSFFIATYYICLRYIGADSLEKNLFSYS